MSILNNKKWKELKGAQLKAETLLRKLGVTEAPVDIRDIAEQMGIIVMEPREQTNWSGALDATRETPVIWARGTDPKTRRNFTIAHEIGHLMLHDDEIIWRDHTFSGDAKEQQANGYAAKLLMPEFLIEDVLASNPDITIEGLARRFEVSPQAMEYRLRNLGYFQ